MLTTSVHSRAQTQEIAGFSEVPLESYASSRQQYAEEFAAVRKYRETQVFATTNNPTRAITATEKVLGTQGKDRSPFAFRRNGENPTPATTNLNTPRSFVCLFPLGIN